MKRTTPLGPKAGMPPDMVVPMSIIALIWGTFALLGLLWLTGTLASAASNGGRWQAPPFAFDTAGRVLGEGPGPVFGAATPVVAGTWIVVGVVVCVGLGLWLARGSRRPMADDPVPALARPDDLPTMTPKGAAERARSLRPSLADDAEIPPEQAGLLLGDLDPKGPHLRASWEDVALAIMAPRAGKTTGLAVPMVLEAPGPVIATSNKSDLLQATWALRRERGTTWSFDPQGIAHSPQRFFYNPLADVGTVGEAARLAGHFAQEVKDGSKGSGDFWTSAATDLLTALILAAASDGRDLAEVYRWLNDSSARLPGQLLRKHGHPALASALEGRQAGAVETREGIYETARTAAQSLRDPEIMAWVTPQPGMPEFLPRRFVASTDTIYAMSKDSGGSAAPLVAALVDSLFRAGTKAAEAAAGRLDPPMLVALDEAANVAKVSDLPDLYSHLGSRNLTCVTILQSYRQGVRVWGEAGMDTLWGAATVKIIGAGIDDPKLAEDISKLVGEHDVTVRSATHGRESSSNLSLRRQRILPPEDIRALPRGRALVLATGSKPALVRLLPWFQGPQAKTISKASKAAEQAIQQRAAQRQETTP